MHRTVAFALLLLLCVPAFAEDHDSKGGSGGGGAQRANHVFAQNNFAYIRIKVKFADNSTATWTGPVRPGTMIPTAWLDDSILRRVLGKETLTDDDRKGFIEFKEVGDNWDWKKVAGDGKFVIKPGDWASMPWRDAHNNLVAIGSYTLENFDRASGVWTPTLVAPPAPVVCNS